MATSTKAAYPSPAALIGVAALGQADIVVEIVAVVALPG
jgi:hypothetical protein